MTFEHVGGGRLLFQRLAQLARSCLHFVEEPCILDRDQGLVGERLEEFFLRSRYRSSLSPSNHDHADGVALSQQGQPEHASPAHRRRKSVVVVGIGPNIVQPHDRLGEYDSAGHLRSIRTHRILRLEQFNVTRADVMAGDEMQKFAVETENVREQASGKRDGVSYDRLEHGLCVGRRGADRAKNFARLRSAAAAPRSARVASSGSAGRPKSKRSRRAG